MKRLILLALLVFILYTGFNTCGAFKTIYSNKAVLEKIEVHSDMSSPDLLNFAYENKIWLHRTDDIEKLIKYQDGFRGLEIDVRHTPNGFMVAHDEDETGKGIFLDDFLSNMTLRENRYIWLDFKNLNPANMEKALSDLFFLLNKYGIPQKNILVESMCADCLEYFTKNGIYTSYYFICDINSSLPADTVAANINACTSKVAGRNISAVSSDVEYYYILKQAFPNMPKYQWYVGNIIERRYKRLIISKILFRDNTVKALLTSRK